MEKTISINIAGSLFNIEEAAFAKLDIYLKSIRTHFASYEDHKEILADIEARIAERFLESGAGNNQKIITIVEVDSLIASMGQSEEFDEGSPAGTGNEGEAKNRKLFRNPDDMIIAGVCSGLAAYFNWDVTLIRVLFVISLFFGGAGVLVYLVLWLAMPEAKTPTEKLQMRGESVTLDSVSEMVKEKVKELKTQDAFKKSQGFLRQLIRLPIIVLGKIIRWIVPVIGALIGSITVAAAGAIALALTFVLAVSLFNIQSPYIDFPLAEATSRNLYFYLSMWAGYVALLIPTIFVLLLGATIASRKSRFNSKAGFALLALWFAAVITVGVTGLKVAEQYESYVATSPDYQTITKAYDLKGFTKLSVSSGVKVEIKSGKTFSVVATGRQKDVTATAATVEDGVLQIGQSNSDRICIFCSNGHMTVAVTMPSLDGVTAYNSSEVTASHFTSKNFALKLYNSSEASLSLTADSLDATLGNSSDAELDLILGSLKLFMGNSSDAEITGRAANAEIQLVGSSDLMAEQLILKTAQVETANSSQANINVTDKLIAKSRNSSAIYYLGAPVVEQSASNSSDIEPIASPDDQ